MKHKAQAGELRPKKYGPLDRASWPDMKRRFAEIFRGKTRAEWDEVFAGNDACVSPVLTPAEAADHPHAQERGSFCSPGGVLQPSPVPRFSRTPGSIASVPAMAGPQGDVALESWGIPAARIAELRSSGALL